MLVLLPLLWLLSAWARDTTPPKDTKYIIRTISSCPDVGYFFKRESIPNSVGGPRCLLCFCQSDGTAICWQRENKRCDVRHYQHGIGRRETRVRRSPFPGFSDIFFRDATRDIFNKQTPQTCKPYETSFSEGCPPDDWCTGCTVCDCDANGRWDCHILSFCPDKKNGTKTKKTKVPNKGPLRRTTVKPNKTTPKGKKNTARTAPRPTRRTTKKPPVKSSPKQINNAGKTNGTRHRSIQKRNNGSPKPLIKKVDSQPKKHVVQIINNTQVLLNANETAKITQEVYKKVALAVQKMITNKISASVQAMKNLQKRSVGKKTQPCVKNSKNAKKFGSSKPNKNKFKKYSGNPKKKAITQKKKFGTTTKKPVKPNGTGEHKKVKRHSQSHILKPTYTPDRSWRMKREIVLTKNTTSTFVNTETTVPDMTTTEKNIIDTVPVTYNYYKYSVVTPEPYKNINEANKDKDEVNYTIAFKDNSSSINNITTEFRLTNKEENNTEIQSIQQNITTIEFIKKIDHNISMDKIPEYNDLKFKEWSHFKLLKNNYLINRLLSLNNTYDIVNGSRNAYYNEIVTARTHTRDIQRLVTPAVRRYNKSRIVNTNSCNTKNTNNLNQVSTFKDRIYHKIEGLQTVLKRLINELRKDNAVKLKPRRFNIIKYLKRFFRKIFKQRKGKGSIALNNKASFNRHIIETICDNFGDCDLTKVNRVVLNKKIKELYAESFNVLKSINIIKGLLHLLDLPQDTTLVNTQNSKIGDQKSNFKGDIHKLNAILKDSYLTSDHKFTETELTQMKYVKKNTQSFIQSVGRFATKLNEIIFILTKKSPDNKRNLVTREAKRNKVNDIKKNKNSVKKNDKTNDKKKIENKKKNNETENNDDMIRKNELAKEYISKLKYMLEKYSIIQGALVDSMQQSLHKFGSISDEKSREDMIDRNKHATSKIVRISSNIINNLKKLKNLAAALNPKHRTKRDVLRDDDAMDYLLTLMEYLLKQNNPLDAAPVNDGIDLLIEAIKTAPDIKPIKKKVLQSAPVNTNAVHTMTKRTTTTTTMPPVKISKEDTSLDSNKISKEDNDTSNAKYDTNEQTTNEEKSEDQPGKIIFEDANTQSVYYNKDTPNAELPEYTTFAPPDGTTEHNNFEKLEKAIQDSASGIDGKKIEVFIGDVEDEDANNEVTSTTAATEINDDTEVTTTTVPIETTEMNLFQVKDRQKLNSIDTSGSNDNSQKRVTLDWLDEGEEQETREIKQNTTERVQTQAPSTKKAVGSTKMQANDNVSSITKELNDDDGRQKKSNPNVEEIMLKKHMDLLNSLDYGTERSEPDDTDSKDGDERYPGEVFPSYFV